MIPRDLHFAHPFALLHLLWIIPILGSVFWAMRKNQTLINTLIHPSLIPSVVKGQEPAVRALRMLSGLLGWVLIVIALMAPQGNAYYPQSSTPQKVLKAAPLDIVIVIDASQSMAVEDAKNQSRFNQAISIGDQLITLLPTDQIALMTFTSRLNPIIPLTYDKPFLRIGLRNLQINEGDVYGTNLKQVLEDLLSIDQPLHPAAYIILSDGGDNDWEKTQAPDWLESLAQTAQLLKAPIFTVGIGSSQGGEVPDVLEGGKPVISRLQSVPLQAISNASQGRYFSTEGVSSTEIAHQLKKALEQYRRQPKSLEYVSSASSFREYFQIPLALGCICLILSWWMPSFRRLIVFICLLPLPFLEANLGDQLFEAKRFEEAALWYQSQLNGNNPSWLQDKLYFNLGTSLAAFNQMKEALAAFLHISPEAYVQPLFRERINQNISFVLAKEPLPPLESVFFQLHQMASSTQRDVNQFTLLRQKLENELAELQSPPLLKESLALLSAAQVNPREIAESAAKIALYQLKAAKTPDVFLERLLLLSGQIQQQKTLAAVPSIQIDQEAREFYPLVLRWQKDQFNAGKCLCEPWNQVLPIFSEGLALSKKWPSESFPKWMEALMLLKSPPPAQEFGEQKQQILDELQEMERQDRPSKPLPRLKGEGVLW